MSPITGQTTFGAPPETVFDLVADERNLYDPRIREAHLLTDGPIGLGTRFRSITGSVRRPVEMTVEITSYERPTRLSTTTHTGALDIQSTLRLEATPTGTRMRWSCQLTPRGPLRLLRPLLPALTRRQMHRVWNSLATRLEHHPACA